jgi:hypothetical protein
MTSIDALSLQTPVRGPTLVGLDLPLTTLTDIARKRKNILTRTQETTTRAKYEQLCLARLIRRDLKATNLDM